MITVVSGIPRSGTSLMMQMLSAGGLPLLTDGVRAADLNNPRGYCEWAPVKSLSRTPEVIQAAEGKVVKVISSLLPSLSNQHDYKVIFMRRPLEEVIASQERMLDRLGKQAAPDAKKSLLPAFQRHLDHIHQWLANQPNITVLYVEYNSVLEAPQEIACTAANFLGRLLDVEAMSRQVEQSLYRERFRERPAKLQPENRVSTF
ncbi:MAG: sulfotransferase domain-containing protein [Candidatus Sulfotelmatobacter sp.]